MRKICIYIAALALAVLVGCGAQQAPSASAGSAAQATPAPTSQAAAPTPATAVGSASAESAMGEAEINETEDETMKISVKDASHEIIYELNGSTAARELYAQLPLTLTVEPFSNNEMTFYPPQKLGTADTPLSSGAAGTLSYYAPWGDVVMFYAPCSPNGSLYLLGTALSGAEHISALSGEITVSPAE